MLHPKHPDHADEHQHISENAEGKEEHQDSRNQCHNREAAVIVLCAQGESAEGGADQRDDHGHTQERLRHIQDRIVFDVGVESVRVVDHEGDTAKEGRRKRKRQGKDRAI